MHISHRRRPQDYLIILRYREAPFLRICRRSNAPLTRNQVDIELPPHETRGMFALLAPISIKLLIELRSVQLVADFAPNPINRHTILEELDLIFKIIPRVDPLNNSIPTDPNSICTELALLEVLNRNT